MTSSIVMGQPVTTVWRTIAADIGGVPQPEKIGQLHVIIDIYFAFKTDAESWSRDREYECYETVVGSVAICYFGPTDAPGNCWSVRAEKIVQFLSLTGKTDGVYGEDWVYV
jgi:hypothetical protein